MQYVAFLRGINVGGKTKVEMAKLREMFESLGFSNIKTILNSGNVIFEADTTSNTNLSSQIEQALEIEFGFPLAVIVQAKNDLIRLIASNPFKDISITKETRLYITFFTGNPEPTIRIPYESEDGDFRILSVNSGIICSVLIVSPKRGTVDLMSVIEKEFGPKGKVSKRITTRNWNTILKLVDA